MEFSGEKPGKFHFFPKKSSEKVLTGIVNLTYNGHEINRFDAKVTTDPPQNPDKRGFLLRDVNDYVRDANRRK